MKKYWQRFLTPKHICFIDDGSGDTGGGGSGFQPTDDGDTTKGDNGGVGDKLDAGAGNDKSLKYSEDDVSRMISARLNSDKSRRIIEKMSKQTGLTADQIADRLESLETQRQTQALEEQAKTVGVDPRLLHAIASQGQLLENLRLTNELNSLRNNVKDYPGFVELEDKIIDKARKSGISLADAYWIMAGQNRVKQSAREAEHRTINERQKQAGKNMVQGDDSSSMNTGDDSIPDDVVAMARRVGMDPQEYYDSMQSKNIDQYRERKTKRKK